jgi:hypothetical protein
MPDELRRMIRYRGERCSSPLTLHCCTMRVIAPTGPYADHRLSAMPRVAEADPGHTTHFALAFSYARRNA